jgi:hypothetical protein
MNTNNNKITLKIIGEQTRVLKTLEKIEAIFPLSVRSKLMLNDDGLNVHCWLTIAIEDCSNKNNQQQPSSTMTKPLIEVKFP